MRKDYKEKRLITLLNESLLANDVMVGLELLKHCWELPKIHRRNLRDSYNWVNQLKIDIEEKIAVLGVSKKYKTKLLKRVKEKLLAGPFKPRKEDFEIIARIKKERKKKIKSVGKENIFGV